MHWLSRPLTCDGEVVLPGLNPKQLADCHPRDVSLRMQVILSTIEMERCEGRLLPTAIFDRMDSLESAVLFGHGGLPRLSDWLDLIREFGDFYGLEGDGPIPVEPTIYRSIVAKYT